MKTGKNRGYSEPDAAQWYSRKRLLAVLGIVLLAVSSIIAYVYLSPKPAPPKFSLRAVIIDQLALTRNPDPEFVQQASASLSAAGFNVTYCNETLDVEFFRNLAKGNYGIIILRVHSAMRTDNSSVDFFTAEPFNMTQHVSDRDEGLVVKGVLTYATDPNEYFCITPRFIENLDGVFPKSIIVAMGCHSLNMTVMADAFLKKGAQAYIGWNHWVGLSTTDAQTLNLLHSFLISNKTLNNAVELTDYDLAYGSRMGLYPASAGAIGIMDLIADSRSISG